MRMSRDRACGEKEEIQVNEMEPGRRGPGRFLGLIIIYTLEETGVGTFLKSPLYLTTDVPLASLNNDGTTVFQMSGEVSLGHHDESF